MARYETFYVYIHRKKTDGLIFYVGKGGGRRAYNKSTRTNHWKNIVEKHGYTVEIYKDGLTHDEASALEMEVISKLRDSGVPLVNLTRGGEGRALPHSPETIEKMRIAKETRSVYCSNGMVFKSGARASEWLRENGLPTAAQSCISACCTGRTKSSHGFAWSYDSTPPEPHRPRTTPTKVSCSNGMTFESMRSAAAWLRENGHPKARQSAISFACDKINCIRYGYAWERACITTGK